MKHKYVLTKETISDLEYVQGNSLGTEYQEKVNGEFQFDVRQEGARPF